jgi:hypothetical protein
MKGSSTNGQMAIIANLRQLGGWGYWYGKTAIVPRRLGPGEEAASTHRGDDATGPGIVSVMP